MPRKYVPKIKRHRRNTRKTYRKKRSVLYKAPMPNKFATKLRYVGYADLDPSVGGLAAVHVLNAIGLYDPDITGVGHQPRGFDQFMTMYDHYHVIGAKVTIDFMHKFNTNGYSLMCGIAIKDSNITYSDPNDYLEGRNIISCVLPATHSTDSGPIRRLSKTFSTKKFFGVKNVLDTNEYKGSATANPNDSAYFHVFCAPFQAVDASAIIVQFRIDYYVVFTEPKQPSQS